MSKSKNNINFIAYITAFAVLLAVLAGMNVFPQKVFSVATVCTTCNDTNIVNCAAAGCDNNGKVNCGTCSGTGELDCPPPCSAGRIPCTVTNCNNGKLPSFTCSVTACPSNGATGTCGASSCAGIFKEVFKCSICDDMSSTEEPCKNGDCIGEYEFDNLKCNACGMTSNGVSLLDSPCTRTCGGTVTQDDCSTCVGLGTVPCPVSCNNSKINCTNSCTNGKVNCGNCAGTNEVTCGDCFTVTWVTNGGMPLPTQKVVLKTNGTILPPAAMDKTGYIFDGWYTEDTFINKVTLPKTDTGADITLYAKWSVIVNAQPPNITGQPQGATYNQNTTATALSVTANSTDGGTLSYQWYYNTTNSTATAGATEVGTDNNMFTPLTDTVGTRYYFVVVTNTNTNVNGTTTATATSDTATVVVNAIVNAQSPNITGQPQGATYNQNTTATALSVTAGVTDGGTLSYQWYYNTTNSTATAGATEVGTDNNMFTPLTDTVETRYYFVVVTNTNTNVNGTQTATATSNTAAVVVNALSYTISVTNPAIASGGTHNFTGATAGYATISPTTFTITNTGTGAMTNLDVALGGTNASSFTLNKSTLNATLGAYGITTFTIKPNDGLAAGSYTATVSITDTNLGTAYTFNISFTVSIASTYSVSVTSPNIPHGNTHTFTGATAGYAAISPTTFTITNNGTGAMTDLDVAFSGGAASSFTLDKTGLNATLGSGGTTTFTIKPNDSLAANTYTATVSITDTNLGTAYTFNISFTVSAVVNAQPPNITGHPQGASVNVGGSVTLTVTAQPTDGGTLSYEWFKNTANNTTGGSPVGSNNASYSPDTASAGTLYYYVVVTNTNNAVNGTTTATATSDTVTVVVNAIVNAQPPNITGHPQGATYNQNTTATALSVTANSTDGGVLSYQWYYNTTNSTATAGATEVGTDNNMFTPLTDTVGTRYYFVVVTNTNTTVNGTQTATATSNTATVVVNALSYTINVTNPAITSGGTHTFTGATAGYAAISPTTFTITNTGTGAMTDLDVALGGTNAGSFTLDKTGLNATLGSGGTTTFTIKPNDGLAANTYTATVSITDTNLGTAYTFNISFTVSAVVNAQSPNITGQPQGATYNQNTTATALSVTAGVTDGGVLSYQWYYNTTNSTATAGATAVGTNSNTFIPPTNTVGTRYYFVVVTNNLASATGNPTATVTSNTAAVVVNDPPVVCNLGGNCATNPCTTPAVCAPPHTCDAHTCAECTPPRTCQLHVCAPCGIVCNLSVCVPCGKTDNNGGTTTTTPPATSPPPATTTAPVTTAATAAATSPVATSPPEITAAPDITATPPVTTAPPTAPAASEGLGEPTEYNFVQVADDAVFIEDEVLLDMIFEALGNGAGEPLVIDLADMGGTVFSAEVMEAIKEAGIEVEIILENGITVRIDPATISTAVNFDFGALTVDIAPRESVVGTGGSEVIIPANSIIVNPNVSGLFGFELSISISAEQLAEAGLNGSNVKLWYVGHDGGVTEMGKVKRNADGSVTISIDSASFYILAEQAPVNAENDSNPTTGVVIGFTAVITAGCVLGISRRKRKNRI